MVVLAALIIFAVVGGIFVNYLRRNQNDIGGGMGKDYMKEHWGIDDDKKSKYRATHFVSRYFLYNHRNYSEPLRIRKADASSEKPDFAIVNLQAPCSQSAPLSSHSSWH
jgi:hypothetical protein